MVFLILIWSLLLAVVGHIRLIKCCNTDPTEQIMEDLEIKGAIDVVKKYVNEDNVYEYIRSDNIYYHFWKYVKNYENYTVWFKQHYSEDISEELLLSKDFTVIKILNQRWNIKKIIDLSPYREKINQEFKDLIQWLALQRQSYLKLNKYMKDTIIELNESQKWIDK